MNIKPQTGRRDYTKGYAEGGGVWDAARHTYIPHEPQGGSWDSARGIYTPNEPRQMPAGGGQKGRGVWNGTGYSPPDPQTSDDPVQG